MACATAASSAAFLASLSPAAAALHLDARLGVVGSPTVASAAATASSGAAASAMGPSAAHLGRPVGALGVRRGRRRGVSTCSSSVGRLRRAWSTAAAAARIWVPLSSVRVFMRRVVTARPRRGRALPPRSSRRAGGAAPLQSLHARRAARARRARRARSAFPARLLAEVEGRRRPARDARAAADRPARRRPRAARGRARASRRRSRCARVAARARLRVPAHPVHARPAARRPRRHADLQPGRAHVLAPRRARSSRTSCSPTRSTARRRRSSRRCSRRCRSGR